MFIRVYDRDRPDNYADTTLFITVIRNPNAPRFTNPDFPTPTTQTLELTVLETVGIGKLVFHINATDDDGVWSLLFYYYKDFYSNQKKLIPTFK